MIVELPNGQELEFPDGTSPEVMRNAIHKNFPEYAAMYKGKESESPKEDKSQEQIAHEAAVRYGIKDPLVGLLNLGSRGGTAAGNLAIGLINKLGGNFPKQEATDFSEMLGIPQEQKNLADKLIQFAPEIGVSLALPESRLGKVGDILEKLPAWGKYLKTGLGNAVSQGLFAASQSPEDQGKAALEAAGIAAPFSAASKGVLSGSPIGRMLSRGLLGAGGAGLGYLSAKGVGANEPTADIVAALMGLGGYHGLNPNRTAAEKVLKGVEGTPYEEALDAAKRLGLTYITPAEASGNPFTGGVQGTIGKTEKGARLLYEKGKERAASEENAIDKLLGNIYKPEKLEERKNALYEIAGKKEVPKSILDEFKGNEIYKEALRTVRKEPVYKEKLKGVPENSIEYVNQIKEALDDMIAKKPKKEAAIIQDTKNNLLDKLDEISPEYRQARQLAERGIVRKEIEELFNKKDETGTNLFKTLLSNKKDYRDLQERFKRLEEKSSTPDQKQNMKDAQQQLEDMRLIFGRLINIPTAKTAEALSRSSMSKERSSSQAAMRYLQEILSGGRYDKAAVELITNPKWADELENLKKITNREKLFGHTYNLLSKAGSQALAQQ